MYGCGWVSEKRHVECAIDQRRASDRNHQQRQQGPVCRALLMSAHQANGRQHQYCRNADTYSRLGKCHIYCIQNHEHDRSEQAVDTKHHGHGKKVMQPNRGKRG